LVINVQSTTLHLKFLIKHHNVSPSLYDQTSGHNNPNSVNSTTMQHANRTRLAVGWCTAFKSIL